MRPSPTQAVAVLTFSRRSSVHVKNAYALSPFVLMGPLLKFLSPLPCSLTFIAPDFRPRGYWWPILRIKVARYSFSGPIPPKFEHKLRRHKKSFGKIATTVVLHKDENLLWSGLQRHRSCHSNKIMLLPILLAAVYLGTENCSSKIVHGSFFLQ